MAYTSPEVEERFMEDIVDRLRVLNFMGPWKEAADEIERLRDALRQISNDPRHEEKYSVLFNRCREIAKDALKEKE
jgi:hypothetical protein